MTNCISDILVNLASDLFANFVCCFPYLLLLLTLIFLFRLNKGYLEYIIYNVRIYPNFLAAVSMAMGTETKKSCYLLQFTLQCCEHYFVLELYTILVKVNFGKQELFCLH
jgi:hypothetical protein